MEMAGGGAVKRGFALTAVATVGIGAVLWIAGGA